MWTSSYIGEKAVEVPLDVSPVVGGAQVFHGRNGRHGERGVLDGALQTLRELARRGHWSCHEQNMWQHERVVHKPACSHPQRPRVYLDLASAATLYHLANRHT